MSRQERILGPLPGGHTESCLQLAELVKENFPGYQPEEFAVGVELAVRRGEAIAALQNNRVLGLLLLSRREGELLFLAVHPSARRMGLARRLIDRGLDCFSPGQPVQVITYREGDPRGIAARSCYHSCGFTDCELLAVYNYPCQRLVRY
ncbi:MAG: GNAT family N-acetyltransferase [Clostridiales bacterium]|nr:GNAT family N-acetyltransferase [Clostridiales bacterium]